MDPAFELHRTLVIPAGDSLSSLVTFPASVRTRPVTFAVSVRRTDTTSSGLIFEIGSDVLGVAAAIDGADLLFAAGGPAAGDAGATLLVEDALPGVDTTYNLVLMARPGDGMIAAWVNGRLVGFVAAADETFAGWTDDDDGSVGAAGEGTVLDRIDIGLQVAPTDFALLSPLSVYIGQVPRQAPQ